jgi:phosphoribosylformylglycinamidine (FGAM) synthase-like amidotransferase family enzyme
VSGPQPAQLPTSGLPAVSQHSVSGGAGPNGSARNIAGIADPSGNIVGLMPHPDRAMALLLGSGDGRPVFEGLVEAAA